MLHYCCCMLFRTDLSTVSLRPFGLLSNPWSLTDYKRTVCVLCWIQLSPWWKFCLDPTQLDFIRPHSWQYIYYLVLSMVTVVIGNRPPSVRLLSYSFNSPIYIPILEWIPFFLFISSSFFHMHLFASLIYISQDPVNSNSVRIDLLIY